MLRPRLPLLSSIVRRFSRFTGDRVISFDKSDFLGATKREEITELTQKLVSIISSTGAPISVYDFMRIVTNSPLHGYYQTPSSKIGKDGDFITAAELGQLFGEIIAIWVISFFTSFLKQAGKIHLIEIGAGKGSLMRDIIRTSNQFPAFRNVLNTHIVELSDTMISTQKSTLQVVADNSTMRSSDGGLKYKTPDGMNISWHRSLSTVPTDGPSIVLGQEILDALPILKFIYMGGDDQNETIKSSFKYWRECMVGLNEGIYQKEHFSLIPSDRPIPVMANDCKISDLLQGLTSIHEYCSSLSLHSNTLSYDHRDAPAYSWLKYMLDTSPSSDFSHAFSSSTIKKHPKPCAGDVIEISPDAVDMVQSVSNRIYKTGGCALFLDYGNNYIPSDTLRGFHQHVLVSPFSRPGKTDVTADVDFATLSRIARSEFNVQSSVIVSQKSFLKQLGIDQRLQILLDIGSISSEEKKHLKQQYAKLIMNDQMGLRFKVMGLFDKSIKMEDVYGFDWIESLEK